MFLSRVYEAIKMVETDFSNGNVTERKNTMNNSPKPLKITAVGDGMVGKTCMLITYTWKKFPEEYVPTVFDNFPCTIRLDDVPYEVTLWDTAGQEDYERLRPLSYPTTACFLLCYSISSKSSFDNIVQKWYPELKHHCPSVPIILVGTKSDLRGTEHECVTPKMAREMKKKISACKVMECSALENRGLDELFTEAVRCSVKGSNKKKGCCVVL